MPDAIQSLWVGPTLSAMEQLSIRSFLQHGHDFYLYVYQSTEGVPAGVKIKDANEILPHSMLFTYPDHATYAGFSNFFRYKLLLENGGWWVDMDTVCLRPFAFEPEYVFSSQWTPGGCPQPNAGAMKVPSGSGVMRYAWERCRQMDVSKLKWGQAGPLLMASAIDACALREYVRPPDVFCPVNFGQWCRVLDPAEVWKFSEETHAIHLWNEMWRRAAQDKDKPYHPDCLYEQLKQRYFQPTKLRTRPSSAHPVCESLAAAADVSGNGPFRAPRISAVVLTKNGAGRIERCLQSILHSRFADEIVVCIDRETSDGTWSIVRHYTDKIHTLQTRGYIESVLAEMAGLCSGDWILRIDDDEALGGDWRREPIESLIHFNDITHFWTPRRWIVPPGGCFISNEPWFPDLQLRLFQNDRDLIAWPVEIHEPMDVEGRGLVLADRWVEHYNLVVYDHQSREERCRNYRRLRPEKHLSTYYLYEQQDTRWLPADVAGFVHAIGNIPIRQARKCVSPRSDYEPGDEIRFDATANGAQYRLDGWSNPEPWGTWTDGHRAVLRIPLARPFRGSARLLVEANAFVSAKHPWLRVCVLCGNEIVGEWAIDSPEPAERSLTIPASLLAGRERLTLAFHIVNPISPAECGESPDQRRLGLGIRRLRLEV